MEDEYKVGGAFRKRDRNLTPDMSAEEVVQFKYQEYGVTFSQVQNMFFRYHKYNIEAPEKNVEVNLKTDNSNSKSA